MIDQLDTIISRYRSELIESGNWLFVAAAFVIVIGIEYRVRRDYISAFNVRVLRHLELAAVGVGINHGWFALSRHLAPPFDTWHPLMYDWRWLMILVTANVTAHGLLTVVRLLAHYSIAAQVCAHTVMVIIALVMGIY